MSIPLEAMNRTELLQILAGGGHGRLRLRSSIGRERLIHLIRTGEEPKPEELAKTTETRARLEVWIEKNRALVGSQLPCEGPNSGKCTIYPCTEARHLNCYIDAKDNFL